MQEQGARPHLSLEKMQDFKEKKKRYKILILKKINLEKGKKNLKPGILRLEMRVLSMLSANLHICLSQIVSVGFHPA